MFKNVMEIFEEQVNKNPNKIALVAAGSTLTYKELSMYTNGIANYLIKTYSIEKGTIIPLIFKPSIEMIIAIFSVIKAGCVYLPIAVEHPIERQKMFLKDVNAKILLSNIQFNYKPVETINIQKLDLEKLKSEDIVNRPCELAYLLYTSGSTGNPKGVEVTHANLLYILNNMQKYYPVLENDKYLLGTPYTFDVSITEIFGWIIGGGSLVISNIQTKDSLANIFSLIIDNKVTHLALSPSILNVLLRLSSKEIICDLNKTLRYLMIAGEEFPLVLGEKVINLLPNVIVSNLYGPTETTVYATHYVLNSNEIKKYRTIPIGNELDEAKIYILDKNNNQLDAECVGEIIITGEGVANGYYKNVTLTDEKFISLNCNDGVLKGYRTGDLGKRMNDGNIHYLGRIDNQVQINGIRVELNEIENCILSNNNVNEVTVLYEKSTLYCFYTSGRNRTFMEKSISETLKNKLPRYMRPSIFIMLDRIPINMNGKADRKRLLGNIENSKITTEDMKIYSNNKDVRKIISIIESILNCKIYDNKCNVFELGGDSLMALEIEITLENTFHIVLPDGFIYSYQKIEEIVDYIINIKEHVKIDSETEIYKDDYAKDIDDILRNAINANFINTTNREIVKKYDTFVHQKIYFENDFNSYIVSNTPISKSIFNISREDLHKALISFINRIPMFKVILNYNDNKELNFYELKEINELIIPIISCHNLSSLKFNELIKELTEICEEELQKNRIGTLRYQAFILEESHQYRILFVMDHCISDNASRHILSRQLLNFIKGNVLENKETYEDYVDFIVSKNKDVEIEDYVDNIRLGNNIKHNNNKSDSENLITIKLEISEREINNIIARVTYVVGLLTCEYYKTDYISLRIVINSRNYQGKSFNNLIGDCHGCTYYLFSKKNYEEFEHDFIDFLNKYHYVDGISFDYLINRNYPYLNDKQLRLRKIMFTEIPVNVNFHGRIRNAELQEYIDGLEEQRKVLSKLKGNMLRAVSIMCEGQLYIFFLNNIELNQKTLDELNIFLV